MVDEWTHLQPEFTFYGDDISSDGILIISRNDKSIINN